MTPQQLIESLAGQGVTLWFEGDNLKYRAPQGALTPDCREMLRQQKGQVLEALRGAAGQTIRTHAPSFAQQALWLLWQAMPGTSAYNVAFCARVISAVDHEVLRHVFQTLTDRHAMLRTTYAVEEGRLVLHCHGYMPADFSIIAAEGLSPEALKMAVTQSYQAAFNLEQEAPMRVRLFRAAGGDHILLIAAHHIAVDGWSMWLLLDEMRSLYQAYRAGRPASLERVESEYTHYIQWQAQMVDGPEGERHWNFWKRQLDGPLPQLNLSPTSGWQPMRSLHGGSHLFCLDGEMTCKIKQFARQEGVTIYMLLLAAYQVLLYRYTGQEDILVSSPMSGRSRPEFAGVLGCFVNPVVIRGRPAGDMSFRDFLGKIRGTVLACIEHQDYPLALLTKRLRPDRSLTRSPLFQVDFVLQKPQRSDDITAIFNLKAPDASIDFGGLQIESYYIPQQEGQLDLSLELVEAEEAIWGTFKFSRGVFEADSVRRMEQHFQRLLAGVLGDPDCLLGALPMLTAAEEQQALAQWEAAALAAQEQAVAGLPLVHQRFMQQAQCQPQAPAVVWQSRRLSYGELERQSNRLANHLAGMGVGPETIVGIFLERSLELIVAVMAVMKAGGAYLPIDPAFPQKRIAHMLEDTLAPFVISCGDLRRQLPPTAAKVVDLEAEQAIIAAQPDANPQIRVASNSLAYVIYTSGTTGRAKGVMVEHRSLANAYAAWEEAYGLTGLRSHLEMASFSFDVFTGDFVRALCSGAKLVLCAKEILMVPEDLVALMQREAVDCAEFVPVVLRNLVKHLDRSGQRLETLKVLICGSDSWFGDEYDAFLKVCAPGTRLINSFGVTEAAIDSTYYEKSASGLGGGRLLPIGKPFRNMQVCVLDNHRQPVPAGVVGELYIGGAGVARGYLNLPELTAERFIQHASRPGTQVRLYKTGDLARLLPDGNIELLGRMDFQVKIRGNRVEPGEVESAIKQYPGVNDAAVIAWGEPQTGYELAAYLIFDNASTADVDGLRQFLKQRLPDYMIPTSFNTLERMPLSPAGKIDRRALPRPEKGRLSGGAAYQAPRNALETGLVGIWQEVLGVKRVGIQDDFFALGGHSLLATQVHSRIQQHFGIRMDLRSLFEATTVAELARLIDTLKWASAASDRAKAGADRSMREHFEL